MCEFVNKYRGGFIDHYRQGAGVGKLEVYRRFFLFSRTPRLFSPVAHALTRSALRLLARWLNSSKKKKKRLENRLRFECDD